MTVPSDFDAASYWEELHENHPGLPAVGFQGLGEPFNAWLYRARVAHWRNVVRPYVHAHATARVLDIGSGTGFYLHRWRDVGVEHVTLSDLSTVAVRDLRRRFPLAPVLHVDIGGPSHELPERRYDAISACDVLFHIVDDVRYARAFRNIATLLEIGGLFVFTENFPKSTRRRIEQVSRSRVLIEEQLVDAGFQVLERRPIFFFLNYPVDGPAVCEIAFRAMAALIRRYQWLGHLFGTCLYPVDRVLQRLALRGPSTDLVVCAKR
jgi:SAM-dependent methyltransferase